MSRLIAVAALLVVAGAVMAIAQPPAERHDPEQFVRRAMEFDADQDGKLDPSELRKFAESMTKKHDRIASPERLIQLQTDTGQAAAGKSATGAAALGAGQVALVFSGGHETDPRDGGRPVVLIAGALGVSADVFREAFSRVRPARAGTEPDPQQVRRNKSALMEALGKHGITNDRLDTVSNYYRYVRSRGEMWPTTAASGYARIEKGKVIGFVVTNGGAGYTSPPSVNVPGMPGIAAKVKLSYGKEFKANGSVSEITLVEPSAD